MTKLPVSKRLEIARWATDLAGDDEWDRQMQADAAAGKLDFLIDEAEAAAMEGKLKAFPRR